MAVIKGKLKLANGDVLYPESSSEKIIMSDAQGQDSTVEAEVSAVRAAVANLQQVKGINIKGSVNGTDNLLPASGYFVGDAYIVDVAGTYAGQACEVGDMLVCKEVSNPVADTDWMVMQTNLINAVTGPSTAVVDENLALFDGTTGSVVKDGGLTKAGVTTAVTLGATLDANKTQLAKITEDANGTPLYNGNLINTVGTPVVANGDSAPANLVAGGLYFESDPVQP